MTGLTCSSQDFLQPVTDPRAHHRCSSKLGKLHVNAEEEEATASLQRLRSAQSSQESCVCPLSKAVLDMPPSSLTTTGSACVVPPRSLHMTSLRS